MFVARPQVLGILLLLLTYLTHWKMNEVMISGALVLCATLGLHRYAVGLWALIKYALFDVLLSYPSAGSSSRECGEFDVCSCRITPDRLLYHSYASAESGVGTRFECLGYRDSIGRKV